MQTVCLAVSQVNSLLFVDQIVLKHCHQDKRVCGKLNSGPPRCPHLILGDGEYVTIPGKGTDLADVIKDLEMGRFS